MRLSVNAAGLAGTPDKGRGELVPPAARGDENGRLSADFFESIESLKEFLLAIDARLDEATERASSKPSASYSLHFCKAISFGLNCVPGEK